MKKRILLVLTVLTMLLCIPLIANAASVDDLTFNSETGAITRCNTEAAGDLVIPAEIDGVKVTKIGNGAFDRCKSLTSITIPNGVTEISSQAFYLCENLDNINLPDSLTDIGSWAFAGTKYINDDANWDNSGGLYIKNYLISIKEDLTGKYEIKNGTRIIADNAFYTCRSLTGITIPDSVKSIGSHAFEECVQLTSITIPDSVASIGNYAFWHCGSLNIDVSPNNQNYCDIDGVLFTKDKTKLLAYAKDQIQPQYVIPDNVTDIGNFVFEGCDMTGVTIPDSVTSIGVYSFSYCINLASINIPSGVTKIGEHAFYRCDSLTDVYYSGTEREWNQIEIGEGNYWLLHATIHYGKYDPITPAVLTVTHSGNSYVLTAETDYDGEAYAAAYDAEGALISVVSEPFADGAATVTPDTAGAAKIKFFVWTNSVQPVTLAKEITLN